MSLCESVSERGCSRSPTLRLQDVESGISISAPQADVTISQLDIIGVRAAAIGLMNVNGTIVEDSVLVGGGTVYDSAGTDGYATHDVTIRHVPS